jgi:hypothetical protein
MPTDPRLLKVPILGQKKQVVCYYVHGSAVITCLCGSPVPIVIPGFDRAGICMTCKRKYVIASLLFKNDNGLVSMDTQIAEWGGPASASADLDVPLTMERLIEPN